MDIILKLNCNYPDSVRELQTMLRRLYPKVKVDGEYGPKTMAAVQKFQVSFGLTVDGEVGKETWEALEKHSVPPTIKPKPFRPATALSRFTLAVSVLAKRYIGQREKPNNSGFLDTTFEKFMRVFGWFTGAAWCAFFARAVWLTVYEECPRTLVAIKKTLGGGCIESWRKANLPGSGFKTGALPKVGAIGYYKHSPTTGHAVVVTDVLDSGMFRTAEGNSNKGKSREGVEVATHDRSRFDSKLLGFVYAPDPNSFGDWTT